MRPKCKEPVATGKIHLIPRCTTVFCPWAPGHQLVPLCHGVGSGPAFPATGTGDVSPDPIPTITRPMGHPSEQGCPQPATAPSHRGKMEKEKERARLAGVSPAEPSAVEVAEDTQKERRLFQLHMCEVGAVLGGTWGQFGTGGTQGTAQSLSPSPPPKQPCVGVVRDPRLSPSHCIPT